VSTDTNTTTVGFAGSLRFGLTLAVLAATLALVLLAPGAASAAFTRQFLCQIENVGKPEGIALDGAGDLWVSETVPNKPGDEGPGVSKLYEFGPAGSSCGIENGSLEIEGNDESQDLAIEQSTGRFYVTGITRSDFGEMPVEAFENTAQPSTVWKNQDKFAGNQNSIALDNSTDTVEDPSACTLSGCTVYVAHDREDPKQGGDGEPAGIEKFNSLGEPVPFSGSGSAAYIKGNEITGTETEGFESVSGTPSSIALDSQGDIYALDATDRTVYEYSASGLSVRAFGIGEAPNLGGPKGDQTLAGIAVDPLGGHLLISVHTEEVSGEPLSAVDEFELSGGGFVDQITATLAGAHLENAQTLAVDSHADMYVLEKQKHAIDVYGEGQYRPGVRIAEASNRGRTSVQLNGSVNPESAANQGAGLSECNFEYVSEAAFDASGFASALKQPCTPSATSIAKDSNYHLVSASLTGLEAGVSYRYRLMATSESAKGGTTYSEAPAFTTQHTPKIESSFATKLSSTFVDLEARIKPLGAATSYYFQYVDAAHYDAEASDPYEAGVSVPMPASAIGAGGPTGSAVASVSQSVGGLLAGTTYDFRVVAESEIEGMLEVEVGTNQSFTTLAAPVTGLADGREYELVTPPDKAGGSDMFAEQETNGEFFNSQDDGSPSDSGNSFLLGPTRSAFGPFPSAGASAYSFTRLAGGWTYSSLASPSLGVQTINNIAFDPADLSRVAFDDGVSAAESEAGERLTSLVGAPGGPYTTLHADPAFHQVGAIIEDGEATEVVGGSPDLSHVVLQSDDHSLCGGGEALKLDSGTPVLCEWSGDSEVIGEEVKPISRFVSVDSEGTLLSHCGAVLGSGISDGGTHAAVSPAGAKLFFTAPDPSARNDGSGGCWNGATRNAPQLYMRSGEKTIKVSEHEEGVEDPTGQHPATYVGASEDGSKVFFLSETWLTKDHPLAHDNELYEYNTETGGLRRISAGNEGQPGREAGAGVLTVPAVATQGTAVYFLAFGGLAAGATPLNEAQVGPVNLYRYDTASASTSYVGEVNTSDYPTSGGGACYAPNGVEGEVGDCSVASWYTTPDGRYLAFTSSRELTAYKTAGPCATVPYDGGLGDGHCEELYRYDAEGGALACVSCNPSGTPPVSNAEFSRSASAEPSSSVVRAMSDDGSSVFFDTADALVPQDTNGTLDVYEWHEGQLSLISSGEDPAPSFFLGASSNGANVFFGTHSKLVREDTDADGDIYDARVCTGEDPCIKPPAGETAQCEGDACQTPPALPLMQAPGTLTLTSSGNVTSEGQAQVAPKAKTKPTRTVKLARALKACGKKPKRMRGRCAAAAQKRYGKQAKRSARARHTDTNRKVGK
jgi:hypothetical protein